MRDVPVIKLTFPHVMVPVVNDMDKYLRSWRQDALNKGQHDAAIYIGDKVLALSSE